MELTPFDPSPFIRDDEGARIYLDEAFATGDSSFIATCIGDVARARGLSDIAANAGLSADGKPALLTVIEVLAALGIRLRPVAASA